jgi:ABC-type transport system involved in cytochrome c biogenesis permease component
VLLLPAATPLLIAGVRATDRALSGPGLVDDLPWLALSLAAAAVYLAAGLLLIDHVLEGP